MFLRSLHILVHFLHGFNFILAANPPLESDTLSTESGLNIGNPSNFASAASSLGMGSPLAIRSPKSPSRSQESSLTRLLSENPLNSPVAHFSPKRCPLRDTAETETNTTEETVISSDSAAAESPALHPSNPCKAYYKSPINDPNFMEILNRSRQNSLKTGEYSTLETGQDAAEAAFVDVASGSESDVESISPDTECIFEFDESSDEEA